jgi:hypothetical protein
MPAKKPEPQCKQVTVSVSIGGKVAMVGFGNMNESFNYAENRVYDVPDGWTDKQVNEFWHDKYTAMRDNIQELVDDRTIVLMEQSAVFEQDNDGVWQYVG